MPRIFISYRRSDSGVFTGRIHDQLKARFGANNVFRDVYNIPAGSDFRTVLNEEVGSTDVCLVMIGPQWVTTTDAQGKRRLDDPGDFVRIEVEEALKNSKTRVIPVLVDNAVMPVAEELPASMAELAYRNAVKVRTDPDFPHDMQNLIRHLKYIKGGRRLARSLWLFLPLILLLIPGFFLFSSQNEKEPPTLTPTVTVHPSETPTTVVSTPTPLVEPVGVGEIMVLVAQIEQIGAQQRDVTRFIMDDLVQRFETEQLVPNVRIREYGDIIKSNTQAQEVSEQTGAFLVIWGQYDDESTTVNVQLGSLASRPDLVIDRDTIESSVDVRLRLKDERQETLAYPILSALGSLYYAENNFLGSTRLVMSIDQLDASRPELLGNTAAAHTQRAVQVFLSDPETASSEITQAIELDAANPLLYVFRSLVYQGMGNFALGRQDSDTAVRLAPDGWIVPYYMRGNESLITGDISSGIDAYTRVIEERPDDWYPYNMRGYLYFLAQNYEKARADNEKSIELGPEAEWPYMWGTLVVLRQGRLNDVPTYIMGIMNNQSKNPVFVQRLMTTVFGEENGKLLGYSMAAIGHLFFGQFDVSAQEADAVLAVMPTYAEMHMLKGLSYCNIDEYQKAEEAYSAGLEVDPSFTMLHFLRAEVRGRLGDVNGAAEDLSVVAQSDISENLQPYIEAARSGQFSCKDMTSPR
ncbi:MAG TPA: TIR domain-containing protein [Anaerolineales bacterium]|nr:TIR domain-containing protein [Anaerolineales bacterium]